MKILGDDDMGKGGIDVLNTETGESTTVRERETDGPFTIDDYNKVMQGANETQQVKRADMINAQNKASEEQQTDTGYTDCDATKSCSQYDALSVSC